jgi:ribosomal subunit interface protein
MQTPFQVTFRSMAHSDAISTHLERRAGQLEQFFDRITSCHVVVEQEGHHHRHGDRYRFSIHVCLPGHEILVNHVAPDDPALENAYTAADRAFDEAERQLEDWVRRRRDLRHEGETIQS